MHAGIRAAIVAAGASAALVAGYVLGAAAAPAIPPHTIHGCVDKGDSRTLKQVWVSPTEGLSCPSGSFQVVFPSGPRTVTAGPEGLDVVIVAGTGIAACPVDHPYVVGGSATSDGGGHPRGPVPPFTSTVNTGGWIAGDTASTTWALCAR